MGEIIDIDHKNKQQKNPTHMDANISKIQNSIKEELEGGNIGKMMSDLKKREKNGTIYKYMWIDRFRKNIISTVELLNGERISKNGRHLKLYSIPSYDEAWLKENIRFWKSAEKKHIVFSIVSLIWMMSAMMESYYYMGWIAIFGFLVNFYCTILQRYDRWRLLSLLEKKKEHNRRKETLITEKKSKKL